MELIRKLGRKLINNSKVSCGIFECSNCKQEVEKTLSNGYKQKSCGCIKNKPNNNGFKHGESKTRLYKIWNGIKNRCLNSKVKGYKDYGGRGITICPEWANDYTIFRDWALSNGYREGLQIHRENDGNYEPGSCKWVTHTENNRKQRTTKLTLEKANEIRSLYATGKYTQKELAFKFGVIRQTISDIINNKLWKNI